MDLNLNVEIETISSIHIGMGDIYQKDIDFIAHEGDIYLISMSKLGDFVGFNQIDSLSKAVLEREPLKKFFNRIGKEFNVEQIAIKKIPVQTPEIYNELAPHIYSPMKGPIIPGSSLKGSIRTALFDKWVKEINFEDISRKKFEKGKEKIVFNDNKAIAKVLGPNADENIMRFIQVGDVQFLQNATIILDQQILNLAGKIWGFKQGSNRMIECIKQGEIAKGKISIKSDWLTTNKSKGKMGFFRNEEDLKNLFPLINNFTKSLLEFEIEFWNEEESEFLPADFMVTKLKKILNETTSCGINECVIRVGSNSGFDFMTGRWFDNDKKLKARDENEKDYQLEAIQKSVQGGGKYLNLDVFPKTRKITDEGEVFGFIKIKGI